ncbi:MAG: hypothetical protein K0Q47_87 [Sedimentibacter sp.]|nr:hypothetical protein [Sedimentibacter sp.]
MSYIQQKLLARDSDECKLISFTDWLANNIEKMGVQVNESDFIDGTYDLSFQEKTNSFVLEINTPNEEFANEAKIELQRLSVDEIRMLGVVKELGVV